MSGTMLIGVMDGISRRRRCECVRGDAGWGKGLGGRWKGSLGVLVAGGKERWNYGEEGGGGGVSHGWW
jgi:hypothetical protein